MKKLYIGMALACLVSRQTLLAQKFEGPLRDYS